MASSPAPVQPYRYMAVFLIAMIGVYLLVFLTGDKQASPKLGIDLQGGTRVTLTARTPDGSQPTREALDQAQQIIAARVNGLGVSGSEVVIDGDNLVITVPGNDGTQAVADERYLANTHLLQKFIQQTDLLIKIVVVGNFGGVAEAPQVQSVGAE